MTNEPTIIRDEVTERGGEPYREIDVEHENGYIDELGWAIDDKSEDMLAAVKRVLDERGAFEFNGVLIDLQTAGCIDAVVKALSETNRRKLLDMCAGDVARLGTLCWDLYGRAQRKANG